MKAEECIFFQLAKASQVGARFWGHKVTELNLTAVQAMVIRFLYDNDGLTSSDLGKRTGLDSATLTGILDRLEAGDRIERKQNPDDRRSILIYLTDKGRATGGTVVQLMEDANAEFLRTFKSGEADSLRRFLFAIRQQA
jgi:DNA-binding MarR family transcriptional regulator